MSISFHYRPVSYLDFLRDVRGGRLNVLMDCGTPRVMKIERRLAQRLRTAIVDWRKAGRQVYGRYISITSEFKGSCLTYKLELAGFTQRKAQNENRAS